MCMKNYNDEKIFFDKFTAFFHIAIFLPLPFCGGYTESLACSQFLVLIGCWGPIKGKILKKKKSKIFSSETVKWMDPVLCIYVPDSSLYIICVFYSGRIRTLVAMVSIDL